MFWVTKNFPVRTFLLSLRFGDKWAVFNHALWIRKPFKVWELARNSPEKQIWDDGQNWKWREFAALCQAWHHTMNAVQNKQNKQPNSSQFSDPSPALCEAGVNINIFHNLYQQYCISTHCSGPYIPLCLWWAAAWWAAKPAGLGWGWKSPFVTKA